MNRLITGPGQEVSFIILGEPASKSNSRRLVINNGRLRFIKSKKALGYVDAFHLQCPQLTQLMDGDLSVTLDIYYASRRPDLDESIVLDAMQSRIYFNDRQIKEKHVRWHLDKANPRAEISVKPIGD